MLEIKNLKVKVDESQILNGINLTVNPGEIHAIMGPNGSGKTTLAYILAGKPGYDINAGSINFFNENIIEILPEERARKGIFLSFQHPVAIPGVRIDQFLRGSLNEIRKNRKLTDINVMEFNKLLKNSAKDLKIEQEILKRNVNEGFSGGERKRNEMLQMSILEPKLAILDEPDSGLDIDAVKEVADSINKIRSPKRSIIIITHYQRILNYVTPDLVHVMIDGKIVQSGNSELALKIEKDGYESFVLRENPIE
tara:strand:- start:624 stop:1382 length:759 start_codon:yes stop_codon:yes gene_type:complete